MTLEIETSGMAILFDLFPQVEAGASVRVPGGATLSVPKLPAVRSVGNATAKISMDLSCGLGVDVSVTGPWLYEKLKGKSRKLWINGAEIRVDRVAIINAITSNKLR
jgi:hypothetical protein